MNVDAKHLLFGTKRGLSSTILLALFAFLAVFGAALAPYDPLASSTAVLETVAAQPMGGRIACRRLPAGGALRSMPLRAVAA